MLKLILEQQAKDLINEHLSKTQFFNADGTRNVEKELKWMRLERKALSALADCASNLHKDTTSFGL